MKVHVDVDIQIVKIYVRTSDDHSILFMKLRETELFPVAEIGNVSL